MPKLTRIVSPLVALCLLIDPAFAHAISSLNFRISHQAPSSFSVEAIPPRVAQAFADPKISPVIWSAEGNSIRPQHVMVYASGGPMTIAGAETLPPMGGPDVTLLASGKSENIFPSPAPNTELGPDTVSDKGNVAAAIKHWATTFVETNKSVIGRETVRFNKVVDYLIAHSTTHDDEHIFYGVLEGLSDSGLDPMMQEHLEGLLWRFYLDEHRRTLEHPRLMALANAKWKYLLAQAESRDYDYAVGLIQEELRGLGFSDEQLRRVPEALHGLFPMTADIKGFESAEVTKDQLALLREDMRRLITEKESTGDRSISVYGIGLGLEPTEALQFVNAANAVIAQEARAGRISDPKSWTINFFGIDLRDGPIRKATAIFNEVSRGHYKGTPLQDMCVGKVFMKAFRGNALDLTGLEYIVHDVIPQAIRSKKAPKADYILHRHLLYITGSVQDPRDALNETLAASNDPHQLTVFLNDFLQTRNVISALGKTGTRYIVEPTYSRESWETPLRDIQDRDHAVQNQVLLLPGCRLKTIGELMPDWSVKKGSLADRGTGILEVVDHAHVTRMGLQEFQQAIRHSLEIEPAAPGNRITTQIPITTGEVAVLFPSAAGLNPSMPTDAQALYRQYPIIRELYNEAAQQSGLSVETLMLFTPETLNPITILLGTFLYSIALYRALEAERDSPLNPRVLVGQSIGTLAAMVVGHAISLRAAVGCVTSAMAVASVQVGVTKYSVLIIENLLVDHILSLLAPGQVELLQDASPAYLTLAVRDGVDASALMDRIKAASRSDVRILHDQSPPDNRGWHMSFVHAAQPGIQCLAAALDLRSSDIPILSASLPGALIQSAEELREELGRFLFVPVYWRDAIDGALALGVERFLEIGPGSRLTSWMPKLAPGVPTQSIHDQATLQVVVNDDAGPHELGMMMGSPHAEKFFAKIQEIRQARQQRDRHAELILMEDLFKIGTDQTARNESTRPFMTTLEEATWDAMETAIANIGAALGVEDVLRFARLDTLYLARHLKSLNEFLDDHTADEDLWVVDGDTLQRFLSGQNVAVRWKRRKRNQGYEQPFSNLHAAMAASHLEDVAKRVVAHIAKSGHGHALLTRTAKDAILREAREAPIGKHIEWNIYALENGGWLGMMREPSTPEPSAGPPETRAEITRNEVRKTALHVIQGLQLQKVLPPDFFQPTDDQVRSLAQQYRHMSDDTLGGILRDILASRYDPFQLRGDERQLTHAALLDLFINELADPDEARHLCRGPIAHFGELSRTTPERAGVEFYENALRFNQQAYAIILAVLPEPAAPTDFPNNPPVSRATVGVIGRGNAGVVHGTGVVIEEDLEHWFVLTNHHVVESHSSFRIFFPGGREVPAELMASDMVTDLALLRLIKSEVPKDLSVEKVSFAPDNDATYSAMNQPATVWTFDLAGEQSSHRTPTSIQTIRNNLVIRDVLEPGASGSPVIDASGHLVGVINERTLFGGERTAMVSITGIHRFLASLSVPGMASLVNTAGESLDGVLDRLKTKGHPIDTIGDPGSEAISDYPAEREWATRYSQMTLSEFAAEFRALITATPPYLDALDYWYRERQGFGDESLMMAFLDHLSEYMTMKHHFGRAISSAKMAHEMYDAMRAENLLLSKKVPDNLTHMESALRGLYRRKAFIRELAFRWRRKSLNAQILHAA